MTKAQAVELQVKWTQQVNLSFWEHQTIDMERTENGYGTGSYGNSFPANATRRSRIVSPSLKN